MIRKMYCIETDKNTLYVDKDVYDYIVSLEQQCINQKEVIDMVSARLEYFLIGNLKYQSSQEEFIKLLNILKGVENE